MNCGPSLCPGPYRAWDRFMPGAVPCPRSLHARNPIWHDFAVFCIDEATLSANSPLKPSLDRVLGRRDAGCEIPLTHCTSSGGRQIKSVLHLARHEGRASDKLIAMMSKGVFFAQNPLIRRRIPRFGRQPCDSAQPGPTSRRFRSSRPGE